jgi:AcrR family transcriptional regulator
MRTLNERPDVVPLVAEVFREFGYEGASLSRITEKSGVGKGSLYHFFPGGKEDMAKAVLDDVDAWFERHVFQPLRDDPPEIAIRRIWRLSIPIFARVDAFASSVLLLLTEHAIGLPLQSPDTSSVGLAPSETLLSAKAGTQRTPARLPRMLYWASRAPSCWRGRRRTRHCLPER